jgi:hypothetical protein
MEFSRCVWFVANTAWVSVQIEMMDTCLLHAIAIRHGEREGHEQVPGETSAAGTSQAQLAVECRTSLLRPLSAPAFTVVTVSSVPYASCWLLASLSVIRMHYCTAAVGKEEGERADESTSTSTRSKT